MSAIKEVLGELFQSVEKLEKAAGKAELKASKRPARAEATIDLFGGKQAYVVDPALVARKLDKTIAGIEKILAEA